jgi:hypothetical protein
VPFNTGLPLSDLDPAPQFDFTQIAQREASFVYTLVTALDGQFVRYLTPLRDSAPTLTHDVSRSVKRTLTLTLDVDDSTVFDAVATRVDVDMVLGNGQTFPLGRYMAASTSRIQTTAGIVTSLSLVDEMFIVAQGISPSFSTISSPVGGGIFENVQIAITRFLSRYPIFSVAPVLGGESVPSGTFGYRVRQDSVGNKIELDVDSTSIFSSASWQLGTDGTRVLEDLAVTGGYYSPWIGNARRFKMIQLFNPDDVVPTFDLDQTQAVIRNSITRTGDYIDAPNRIIVISNAASGTNKTSQIVGTFDVPSSAPHSIENRGFVVPKTYNIQVKSIAEATTVAQGIAVRQQVIERVELSTPPDPRHDSYDVIRWDGDLWLEIGWTLTLTEGAPMRHVLQRIFQ